MSDNLLHPFLALTMNASLMGICYIVAAWAFIKQKYFISIGMAVYGTVSIFAIVNNFNEMGIDISDKFDTIVNLFS